MIGDKRTFVCVSLCGSCVNTCSIASAYHTALAKQLCADMHDKRTTIIFPNDMVDANDGHNQDLDFSERMAMIFLCVSGPRDRTSAFISQYR